MKDEARAPLPRKDPGMACRTRKQLQNSCRSFVVYAKYILFVSFLVRHLSPPAFLQRVQCHLCRRFSLPERMLNVRTSMPGMPAISFYLHNRLSSFPEGQRTCASLFLVRIVKSRPRVCRPCSPHTLRAGCLAQGEKRREACLVCGQHTQWRELNGVGKCRWRSCRC